MDNCVFCKIINKELPAEVVFEDNEFIAFLSKGKISEGHTLLIPKKHYEDVFDIDRETLKKLIAIAKDISLKMVEEKKATAVNLLNASGKDAEQTVFHFHLHIVPRNADDGLNLWYKLA